MFKKIIKLHENLSEISLLNMKGGIPSEILFISFSKKYVFMLFDTPDFKLKFNDFKKHTSDSVLKMMGFIS